MRLLLHVLLLAGCERDLIAQLPDAPGPPPDAAVYCPANPAQPLAPGRYKVFLNTEGVTLRTGGDDATTNHSRLIQIDNTMVPAFLPGVGVADRAAYIAQIVAAVQTALAPWSIDIVTTRPAVGPYQMVVLGGDPVAVIGGCPECSANSAFVCQPVNNFVDLVFDGGNTLPPGTYATLILDDLGSLNGLVATVQPNDCMCRFDTPCLPAPASCTFGMNVPTTMALSGDTPPAEFNCGRATQDEPKILKEVLGCR